LGLLTLCVAYPIQSELTETALVETSAYQHHRHEPPKENILAPPTQSVRAAQPRPARFAQLFGRVTPAAVTQAAILPNSPTATTTTSPNPPTTTPAVSSDTTALAILTAMQRQQQQAAQQQALLFQQQQAQQKQQSQQQSYWSRVSQSQPFGDRGPNAYTLIIIVGCIAVFLILCWLLWDYIKLLVAYLETIIFWIVKIVTFPFRVLWGLVKCIAYPIKQCIHGAAERCHTWCNPYAKV